MDKLIEALQIFLKYGNPEYPTDCLDDFLIVFMDPKIVSEEDKKRLDKLGFFPNEGEQYFQSVKYGGF